MLTRKLSQLESLVASKPANLARWHYCENGENHNPYVVGTSAYYEYQRTFTNLQSEEDHHI